MGAFGKFLGYNCGGVFLESALSMTIDPGSRQYDRIILTLFLAVYEPDADLLPFSKEDLVRAAEQLGIVVQNVPDVIYTYRTGRAALPIDEHTYGIWAIEGTGKGSYHFVRLHRSPYIDIPQDMAITSILDATPLIVLKYQQSDEQALLARIRYNRLIDIFTGLTAYHLQGHFRTTVPGLGQVEIDDLYIGVDGDGMGTLIPVEAKSHNERLGVVQIVQMVRFAREHFPDLPVRPLGVIVQADGSLLFAEFNAADSVNDVATERFKRYRLDRE